MRRTVRTEQAAVAALLGLTALLYLWGLSVSGYANSYYSAAAMAGAQSWKAMLFGSLDPANAITIDKPPLAVWPMALSVRAFGLSSWSILVPQALEGVASVGILVACVRRTTGALGPGLVAGTLFALTPVAALVFRYNNPDALLTLLLVSAAYALLRSLDGPGTTRWLVLVGTLCGLAFLTKMLEAWLVVPALAITYAAFGPHTLVRRVRSLLVGFASMLGAAGWWVLLVELWPVQSRPYVGGSPTNSVLELALGYNGVGRLTGSTGTTATTSGLAASNIARIGRTDIGAEVAWLLPAVIVLGIVGWLVARHHPRRREVHAGLCLWAGWIVVSGATFAAMVGIFHSYYTVIMAPALAAIVAIGAWLLWDLRRLPWARTVMAWALVPSAVLAGATILVLGGHLRWTALPVAALGIGGALLWHPRTGPSRVAPWVGAMTLVGAVAGPAIFSVTTATQPHTGSNPLAGPDRGQLSSALVAGTNERFGGFTLLSTGYAPLSPAVVEVLSADAERYDWTAAALGARSASAYQLASGAPVLAIGGYKGTDPTPALPDFRQLVAEHRVHWLVLGGTHGLAADAIETWATHAFEVRRVDGRTLVDLTQPVRSDSGSRS